MRVSSIIASCLLFASMAGGALAQSSNIEGNYRDRFGTTFAVSECGERNDICAVLTELRGDSRTVENLAFLGRLVLRASQTEDNQWQGRLSFNGANATATVTRKGADVLTIRGCRGLFCSSLDFSRI